MLPLPIDAVLPELAEALRSARAVVLEAPPGAGKTTRVPWAVQAWLGRGRWRSAGGRASTPRGAHGGASCCR